MDFQARTYSNVTVVIEREVLFVEEVRRKKKKTLQFVLLQHDTQLSRDLITSLMRALRNIVDIFAAKRKVRFEQW